MTLLGSVDQHCPVCHTYYPAEPLPFYGGRPLLMKLLCLLGVHTEALPGSENANCCVRRVRSNCSRCKG